MSIQLKIYDFTPSFMLALSFLMLWGSSFICAIGRGNAVNVLLSRRFQNNDNKLIHSSYLQHRHLVRHSNYHYFVIFAPIICFWRFHFQKKREFLKSQEIKSLHQIRTKHLFNKEVFIRSNFFSFSSTNLDFFFADESGSVCVIAQIHATTCHRSVLYQSFHFY